QVRIAPDSIAVINDQGSLTYREVNEQANRLAHHLIGLGVSPGKHVGICLQRDLTMIPALLGVLKTGAAYVPIEPSLPESRVEWILKSLTITCLVTHSSVYSLLFNASAEQSCLQHVILLDDANEGTKGSGSVQADGCEVTHLCHRKFPLLPVHDPERSCSSTDTAYVIFTSGSTGTPKGVVVAHRPVINLIEWVNRTFQVCDSDRLLFVTSLSFDLSVYDVFGILAAGGSIRIVTADEIRDPQRLLTILETEPITFWDSAPQALNQLSPLLAQRDGSRAGELRLVFLSGDWIPVSLPTLLQQAFPRVEVVSLGGATEATVWSNFYRIAHVDSQWKSIPYGKPIQNSQYYILDPCRNPCPVGVTGELYIGGDCLANGYTDSNRTAEQFIEHSLAGESRRLYRTGDLARFEADGNIELIGRIDHQVKIRGYRIELGEIESVLRRHKQVDDAVVVVHDSAEGEKRLVAYVVLRHSVATNQQELRAWLRVRLPGYMIPSAFVTLDRLPLNSSGKLDRRALPKPDFRRIDCESQYVAPRSPTEVQLVQVWQRLLGVEPIGVADNFFDLGGHSLLAARMQLEIARSLHRTVPLATLLQSPTVAKLAQAIDREDCVPACQSLAIIQSGAARRPLFCIHVLGRGLKFFRPLVAHLDPSLPVYGLSTQFLVGDVPEHRVEPLADFYVREIRSIQPEGPYSLVGLSFGGLVALEVARRLEAGGQEVGL
ncbi:MAG: amino acid adenylation domain-containing protein, partial [Planctomycetales bacterium]|nr:amino acid adenylation domain-containing protein [Planctomycetales bacterium]